jgi:hypothetical protein
MRAPVRRKRGYNRKAGPAASNGGATRSRVRVAFLPTRRGNRDRERSTHDRLTKLLDQIIQDNISAADIKRELVALLNIFGDVTYRRNLDLAIRYMQIYGGWGKSKSGKRGRENVRMLLIRAISQAIARLRQ